MTSKNPELAESARIPDLPQLWNEFSSQLRKFVRKWVASEEDAADILQISFEKMHNQLKKGKVPVHPRGWIFQIVRNTVIDHYRRSSGKVTQAIEELELASPEAAPSLEKFEKQLSCCIRPFLSRLPPKYAEALALIELEGVSQTKAAHQLGLSISGMKSRVQRGREMLRQAFLRCCEIQLDSRNRLMDYQSRPTNPCACGN